ncbi:MAG: Co2+/Mg2+ efflux protein ApaG [Saprospiraceae bacterium]|nr:Co2+/Mg2+ efflux protein ApaG [Saprospiraceae bacterium]
MNVKTTDGITIRVKAFYEEGVSKPQNKYFAFSYGVEIENNSSYDVQLLSRYWIIKDSNLTIREVEGEGVIGEQPIIKPDGLHHYSSWVPLHTTVGKMAGYYKMKRLLDGSVFKAYIPEFHLVADFVNN